MPKMMALLMVQSQTGNVSVNLPATNYPRK